MKKGFYRFSNAIFKPYLKLFYGLEVHGAEHLNHPAGAIVAPNHASNFDPPVVAVACPYELHFLAKHELFSQPVLNWLLPKLNTHPLHQSVRDFKSLKNMLKLLKKGEKVVIFPEGERTLTGEMNPLKDGLGFMMTSTKSAAIPTYIHGSYEAWKRQKALPKFSGKMACVFGSPILCDSFSELPKKEAHKAINAAVEKGIKALRQWYLDGAVGTPP
ncbi:MAG: lysophospholipid acyltransferase family protein [Chlamydiota bacterium]